MVNTSLSNRLRVSVQHLLSGRLPEPEKESYVPRLSPFQQEAADLYAYINSLCPCFFDQTALTPYARFHDNLTKSLAKIGYTLLPNEEESIITKYPDNMPEEEREVLRGRTFERYVSIPDAVFHFWGAVGALNLLRLQQQGDFRRFVAVVSAYLDELCVQNASWFYGDPANTTIRVHCRVPHPKKAAPMAHTERERQTVQYLKAAQKAKKPKDKVAKLLLQHMGCEPLPVTPEAIAHCRVLLEEFCNFFPITEHINSRTFQHLFFDKTCQIPGLRGIQVVPIGGTV